LGILPVKIYHSNTTDATTTDNANQAQALTLKVLDYSNHEIEQITGIPKSTILRLYRREEDG